MITLSATFGSWCEVYLFARYRSWLYIQIPCSDIIKNVEWHQISHITLCHNFIKLLSNIVPTVKASFRTLKSPTNQNVPHVKLIYLSPKHLATGDINSVSWGGGGHNVCTQLHIAYVQLFGPTAHHIIWEHLNLYVYWRPQYIYIYNILACRVCLWWIIMCPYPTKLIMAVYRNT